MLTSSSEDTSSELTSSLLSAGTGTGAAACKHENMVRQRQRGSGACCVAMMVDMVAREDWKTHESLQ